MYRSNNGDCRTSSTIKIETNKLKMEDKLNWLELPCKAPDELARQQAVEHQNQLTKPQGSLGLLEEIALDFAAWQGTSNPTLEKISITIFAADHGICQQGVSAFPQEVTAQMILNFIQQGAAISVLAKDLNADFKVINLGTVSPIPGAENTNQNARYIDASIASCTADFSAKPAMTSSQLLAAIETGANQIGDIDLFIGGEMGIGNTTSASAIYSALLKRDPQDLVGPGTGVDLATQTKKAELIARAIQSHSALLTSPLETLRVLGGFEIAALTGAYIKAAQKGIPSLIDGFICTAAALVATKINPSASKWFLFGHQSAEPAHQLALNEFGATPLLNLNMRLGEASGAAVAVPIIKSALSLHNNMATFASAGVSDSDA